MTREPDRSEQIPAPRKPRGRPKRAGRIVTRYSIVTTTEYRAWMTEFLAHLEESEISDVFREAIKAYANAKGFRPPPKR